MLKAETWKNSAYPTTKTKFAVVLPSAKVSQLLALIVELTRSTADLIDRLKHGLMAVVGTAVTRGVVSLVTLSLVTLSLVGVPNEVGGESEIAVVNGAIGAGGVDVTAVELTGVEMAAVAGEGDAVVGCAVGDIAVVSSDAEGSVIFHVEGTAVVGCIVEGTAVVG